MGFRYLQLLVGRPGLRHHHSSVRRGRATDTSRLVVPNPPPSLLLLPSILAFTAGLAHRTPVGCGVHLIPDDPLLSFLVSPKLSIKDYLRRLLIRCILLPTPMEHLPTRGGFR